MLTIPAECPMTKEKLIEAIKAIHACRFNDMESIDVDIHWRGLTVQNLLEMKALGYL